MKIFPCKECPDRGMCRMACNRLHKFLREDLKCHTRSCLTEKVLSPEYVAMISDREQASPSRLTLKDLADTAPGYWDIELTKNLTKGEQAIISCFYLEGMSYKEIALRYRISVHTVERRLIEIKKRLRRVSPLRLLAASQ